MSIKCENDIFRLEIAIDDVESVEMVERESNFGCVELCDRFWDALRGGGKVRGGG
jgi:hypothetical protein